jgi:glycosyltransferase involved in cell wall biosynthesis
MKKKNRICFICYRKFPDINFENYSKFVAENKYDVSVISYLYKNQPKYEEVDKRKIWRIKLPVAKSNKKKILYFIKETVKILKRQNFSIIHIHHTCKYFLLIKLLNYKKSKYIYHITSYPIAESHFQSYKQMMIMFLQSLFFDKIIIQSSELKEKLIGIRNLEKASVVPIGYNAELFYAIPEEQKLKYRKKLQINHNEPIIIYHGAISKFRKLDRLIEAFKFVTRKIPGAKLLMIGNGNDLANLIIYAKNMGLEKNIFFLGKIPHRKIREYLNIADIGISYIPINENYNYNPPLKTFEYLACGLPTIATKTVSNCNIIKNGVNGILIDDDANNISKAIIEVLNNKAKQNYLSTNAIKSMKNADFQAITKKKLIFIYQSILEKK